MRKKSLNKFSSFQNFFKRTKHHISMSSAHRISTDILKIISAFSLLTFCRHWLPLKSENWVLIKILALKGNQAWWGRKRGELCKYRLEQKHSPLASSRLACTKVHLCASWSLSQLLAYQQEGRTLEWAFRNALIKFHHDFESLCQCQSSLLSVCLPWSSSNCLTVLFFSWEDEIFTSGRISVFWKVTWLGNLP